MPHSPARPDRQTERTRWTRSADAWDRWADRMAEPADRMNQPLLRAVGLAPGHRLLDLASGTGEPALSAAAMVGEDGLVVATDLVASMLEGTRRRAAQRRTDALHFSLADMEHLPFAAASFDRVTCRFGLMFAPDAVRAAAEVARVLRPGGIAGFVVWGPAEENTLFRELAAAVDTVLGPDPEAGMPILFRFAAEGSLAAALAEGGLEVTDEQPLRLDHSVPAGRPFWAPTLDMGFAPRLTGEPAERLAAVRETADQRFRDLAGPDGMVPVRLHARLCIGRKA